MPTRNELFAYVKATFGTEPDYPWPQEPEYAVLRHADNGKWYGIVMSVPQSKLGLPGKGNAEIINVKSTQVLDMLLYGDPGILPAYHMNISTGSQSFWKAALPKRNSGPCSWKAIA